MLTVIRVADAAREGVDDKGYVHKAAPSRHIGQIRNPQGVRARRGEVPTNDIRQPPESRKWAWQIRTDYRRSYYDPTANKLYEALASPDPAVALNLFGDGTVQGVAFAELFGSGLGPNFGFSEVTSHEPLLRGQLFRLWGGSIDYAVGADFRREVFISHSESWGKGGLERDYGPEDVIGVERPTTDLTAYFAELAFPIIGPDNARPGLRSLVLSIQARRDTYKTIAANGGQQCCDYEDAVGYRYVPGEGWITIDSSTSSYRGTPNIIEVKNSATSPRIGVQYKPVETFTARAAWSRSFQPPPLDEVFNRHDGYRYTWRSVDPYHPDGSLERVPYTEFRVISR